MSEELKSCPFCGGLSGHVVGRDHLKAWVFCPDCDTEGPAAATHSEAITAWNTRAGEKV